MITPLTHLIAEARGLANDHPCTTAGHAWEMDGGPGHRFCFSECQRKARITTEDGK